MFTPEFKERGLVRAVFVVDMDRCGCVDATSREQAEKRGKVWAVGKWHRDDDARLQEKLDHDFEILARAYKEIGGNSFCGGAYCYEYKPYAR